MEDLVEANTHAFIVKIWVDDPGAEKGQPTWRGHITHVLTNKRHPISRLSDITTFVAPYLEEMGVKPGRLERLCMRLEKWGRPGLKSGHGQKTGDYNPG
jgi:hypothetical protein